MAKGAVCKTAIHRFDSDRRLIMIIGVISDTHGELNNLRKAVENIRLQNVEIIVHLGDDYEDCDILDETALKVIKVPGVFSALYQDRNIPNRIIKEFCGKKVLISHTLESHANDLPDDIKPENLLRAQKIDMILYGHTHIPKIEIKNNVILFNPGHLKTYDKKGADPSFGIINFKDKIARIFGLFDNKIIQELLFI